MLNKTSKQLMIFLFMLLLNGFILAQIPKNNFVHFTPSDGLPSSNILDIFQDRFGYVWIGTSNGLSRYDGYKFKNYNQEIDNDASLRLNIVGSIFEDSRDDLWVGGLGGLSKYNRKNDNFDFYSLNSFVPDTMQGPLAGLAVFSISEDKDGVLWLGVSSSNWSEIKDGVFYLDKSAGQIKKYEFSDGIHTQNILTSYISQNGEIWFGGFKGLGLLNPKLRKIEFFIPKNSEKNFEVNSIVEDEKGILWLGTHNNGLQSFNSDNFTFKQYHIKSLLNSDGSDIGDLVFDEPGNIWLTTSEGLIYFKPKTKDVQHFIPEKDNPASIKHGSYSAILRDLAGSMWIGGWNDEGLSRYDPKNTDFQAFVFDEDDPESFGPGWATFFIEDHKNDLWIGTGSPGNFLHRFNRENKKFSVFPSKDWQHKGYISLLFEDSKDELWFAINGHLFGLSPDGKGFEEIPVLREYEHRIINSFYEDTSGILWFGREDGLFSYDQITNNIKHFTFDSLPGTSNESNRIFRLVADKDQNIWIASNNGLFKYTLQTKSFSRIGLTKEKDKSLSDHDINSLYIDPSGIVWVGTWFGGLNRFDPQNGIIKTYTKKNGLAANSIQGILGDEENGALWLSTYAGITRFDLQKESFLNFNTKDGVHSTEFADGAYLKTSKGEFLFGGANGFTMFKPEDIKENITPPKITITDFKLANKSVVAGSDSPLKEPVYDADEIILAHDQNDISFEFLAIHFINSQRIQHAYMLENYESEWRNIGSQRAAIYPNLPPGDYTFRVKAANHNNYWSKEEAIKVTILYPWWRSTWAYIAYIFLITGIIFVIDRFQRKRLIAKERSVAEIKEAQLRAQVAEAENERKSKELEEARQLQLSMLPKKLPQLPHLDIAVYMQTATEVGGDYYDFHVGLDGTLTVVIGDATGHGMKAGTMVTAAKSLFNSYAPNPDILFSFHEFTRCIKKMNFDKLSMCMTMLKITKNEALISAAGMPPTYIYRKDKKSVEEMLFKGMPLGTMEKFPYEIKETALNVGDTLLLMSDGLPELENSKNEQFGYQRIHDLFMAVAENSAEEIIDRLKNNGKSWINEDAPDDDITFVVIKVK